VSDRLLELQGWEIKEKLRAEKAQRSAFDPDLRDEPNSAVTQFETGNLDDGSIFGSDSAPLSEFGGAGIHANLQV